MRNIIVLTVFSLLFFATARCVDAGVILDGSVAGISECSTDNSAPLQEEEPENFRQGDSSEMSSPDSIVHSVAYAAVVGEIGFLSLQTLSGTLGVLDELLPTNPVLFGLLKPA